MRSIFCLFLIVLAASVLLVAAAPAGASDYNGRFIRNYPPGFYGMWYYAERFYHPVKSGERQKERYSWDRYMSKVTHLQFPFEPIPFDWEYGSTTNFNLPDYNTNDWR